MDSIRLRFQIFPLVLLLLLLSPSLISSTHSKIPRLGIYSRTTRHDPRKSTSRHNSDSELKTFYYDQKLDHFTYTPESYTTFRQRYIMNFKYWGGSKANAPIFAFLGAEENIDDDVGGIGFIQENALRFKALLVYLEHRYYGISMPFGSAKEALKNASTLGYFSSAQAIADYAAILLHIKTKLSADNSPTIVVGGSYGGMLAAWFRLKYPHVALGALASSAPLLYFQDTPPKLGYYTIVTKVYKETSKNCYETIRKSWDEIDRVASKPGGLSLLSKKFRTCAPLKKSSDLKDYLDSIYADSAQYHLPSMYPVTAVCGGINGAPKGTDLLGRIFQGVVAFMTNESCYDMKAFIRPTNDNLGWRWQTCSELVMPVGHDRQDTMFQTDPFNITRYKQGCVKLYGVEPQPHWITTYYGGLDWKLILRRFGSNIIFSNGLNDPYSVGGVLEDISDSILAITTNGSHCMDIHPGWKEDPKWLIEQREKEVQIIEGWIAKYYKDLQVFKDKKRV